MRRVCRITLAACAVAIALAAPSIARAELCLKNADCPTTPLGGGRTCVKQQIFGVEMFWGNCDAPGSCNTGRDCIPQAECRLGFCQRPVGVCDTNANCLESEQCVGQRCEPIAPPGKGSGIPGEGRHCIPPDGSKPSSWAQDSKGKPLGACPVHTRCNEHGFCVRLET